MGSDIGSSGFYFSGSGAVRCGSRVMAWVVASYPNVSKVIAEGMQDDHLLGFKFQPTCILSLDIILDPNGRNLLQFGKVSKLGSQAAVPQLHCTPHPPLVPFFAQPHIFTSHPRASCMQLQPQMHLCLSSWAQTLSTHHRISEVVSSHIPHAYSFASHPPLAQGLPLHHRLHSPTK